MNFDTIIYHHQVPRHVTRLVTPLIVDYSASRRLVADNSTLRRLIVENSASRRLVVDYIASRERDLPSRYPGKGSLVHCEHGAQSLP
jgi:hypothetical protein